MGLLHHRSKRLDGWCCAKVHRTPAVYGIILTDISLEADWSVAIIYGEQIIDNDSVFDVPATRFGLTYVGSNPTR